MKKKNIFKWADPTKKFICYDLEPNEVFSEEYAYYKLDVSNLNFDKIDARRALFNKEVLQRFLDENKIKINVDDFITIFNLQSYIHMFWPDHAKDRPHREEIFKNSHRGKDNPMWLSDAFNKKIAACVECCLLAQLYLQHCGIESKICCGNAFFKQNPDIEKGGDAHAYMLVRFGNQVYIYDPSNPMLDSKKAPTVPRIMDFFKVPFKDRRAFKDLLNQTVADGGGFAYVEASDIYGVGSCWLYGFESDDNSLYSKASRQRTAKGIKRQTPNQQAPQQIYGQGGHRY
jgi:hypothetical protein